MSVQVWEGDGIKPSAKSFYIRYRAHKQDDDWFFVTKEKDMDGSFLGSPDVSLRRRMHGQELVNTYDVLVRIYGQLNVEKIS